MKKRKTIKRLISYILLAICTVFILLIVIKVSPALWKHFVTYPQLEKDRTSLWKARKEPPRFIPLTDYKGVMHSHTYWSHDSRGTLPEILYGAKKAKLNFIFLSDHPHGKMDIFPRGYHGVYDDIIIEPGTESSSGLMVSPFDSVTLNWGLPFDTLVQRVVTNGGMVTYVHTEKPHPWHNPDYQAMEIYNIHTDLLDEKDGLLPFVINSIVNGRKYRHWAYRELYDDQTTIWARWDSLNLKRKIVGVSAVDAHNNNNFRARYLPDGRVEWVGPNADTLSIKKPGWKEKLLLGKPDQFGWAFKWEMDPYFNSFNYVNDHVLCDTFSNVNIKENILKGHVYIAFESLAEASGFQYYAVDGQDQLTAMLGDEVPADQVTSLEAVSPYPVRYELYLSGRQVKTTENSYRFNYKVNSKKGNYRLVAKLWLGGQWLTWVMTNPIYIK